MGRAGQAFGGAEEAMEAFDGAEKAASKASAIECERSEIFLKSC